MNPNRSRPMIVLVLVLLVLSACNLPSQATPTQSGSSAIYTAAAQTVAAQLTEVAKPPSTAVVQTPVPGVPTNTPLPIIPTDTPLPPTPIPPTNTPLPPTPVPIPCDRVKFVKDVTIPDNTELDPGAVFVKTWRLQNDGSCTWTSGYALVFSGGDPMETPAAVPLTSNVAPGQTVDVSVTLTAPSGAGTYRGEYKMRNASNVLFGLGDSNKPFWVQIKVVVPAGIVYDFIAQASSATWTSQINSNPPTPLTFGGADDDPNGVVKIKDGVKLENGATSGKVLLTYPRHDNNGVVSGLFSPFTVRSGDHFRARLGFMIPGGGAGTCGNGKVIFQLVYLEGGALHLVKQWPKSCDGNLLSVDADLSNLNGHTVQFAFIVLADGSFQDDWAVWNSPRIEH